MGDNNTKENARGRRYQHDWPDTASTDTSPESGRVKRVLYNGGLPPPGMARFEFVKDKPGNYGLALMFQAT